MSDPRVVVVVVVKGANGRDATAIVEDAIVPGDLIRRVVTDTAARAAQTAISDLELTPGWAA